MWHLADQQRRKLERECGSLTALSRRGLALQGAIIPLAHHRPVHDVPPSLDVVGTLELILQVVGMLPNVAAEDGNAGCPLNTVHQRVVLVRGRRDGQALVLGDHEPHPPRAKACARSTCRLKLRLHVVERPESLVDSGSQSSRRLASSARWRHLGPEHVVIVEATSVVANRIASLYRALLQVEDRGLLLVLQGLIDVREVRVVVLVVVELHGRLVD
mmetsp:Transcript_85787/g.223871  ORF Transcript_85787/g.223871 Transcript_85787/m.223871 type:complete len:216 (-) Transcript_85787:306-953(-)